MDPAKSAAANLFSLSALAALQPAVAHFSTHSPALEFTGQPIGADAEAKLIDYRSEKVAGFEIDGDTLICLPQAYDLFLKNLVGGLHTVYTKLKRLDIIPRVCNVEQVRALRSLGAIQPGVNRCKLISCKDFDALFLDCTSASSRPGRPPKRSPPFGGAGMDYLNSLKKPRFNQEQSDAVKVGAASMTGQNPIFSSQLSAAQQLFPLLNPFTAQQLMMSQMMSSAANQAAAVKHEDSLTPDDGVPGRSSGSEYGFSASSNGRGSMAVNQSETEMNGDEDPLNLVKPQTQTALVNGEDKCGDDEKVSETGDSGSETPTFTQQSQSSNRTSAGPEHFMWPGLLKPELYRGMQAREMEAQSQESSVESLLLNILGLIEIAASAVKKQELNTNREKNELVKLLEEEKGSRAKAETALKEEQRQKKMYQKRWKQTKRSRTEIQSQLLTLLEKQQSQNPEERRQTGDDPPPDQSLNGQSLVNGDAVLGTSSL